MQPLLLHYSRGKLIRLALLSLIFVPLGLWIAAGGASDAGSGRGRRASIGRLLGPEGLQWLGWAVAAIMAAMALFYFRRAFADLVAARADVDGVKIYTLFGTHAYPSRDIDRIELRWPAGQPILQIVPAPGRGKKRGLAVNGLAEDADEVAAWIESVGDAWHGRSPDSGQGAPL